MSCTKFPYNFKPVTWRVDRKWKMDDFVEIGPKRYSLPRKYATFAENVYNFEVRPDDVWVVTYPKAGTTLTQEMSWLIVNDDYEMARNVPLIRRFPFFEYFTKISEDMIENEIKEFGEEQERLQKFLEVIVTPGFETLEKLPNKRFIKTHLPLSLLPPTLLTSGCKVIYVARNPKDAAVSFFKFRYFDIPDEDFEKYWKMFQNNMVTNAPFWEHIQEGWEARNNKNFYFVFYEDMVQDLKTTITKMSTFLERDMTEEQVNKLAEHLHIENFRKNKSISVNQGQYFKSHVEYRLVRKGRVGGWKSYFSNELNNMANIWINENYKKTDLRFPVNLM